MRARQRRNFLATLLLSQGVPMICGGDEIARTQGGNNNAYCQDNEISWLDWERGKAEPELLAFSRYLTALRRRHPVFHRRRFFQGRSIRGEGVKDLTWFEPSGREMTDQDWQTSFARSLMVRLSGEALDELDAHGRPVEDDTFLLLLNAAEEGLVFNLPPSGPGQPWQRVLDTGDPQWGRTVSLRGERYRLRGRALALFRSERPGSGERGR